MLCMPCGLVLILVDVIYIKTTVVTVSCHNYCLWLTCILRCLCWRHLRRRLDWSRLCYFLRYVSFCTGFSLTVLIFTLCCLRVVFARTYTIFCHFALCLSCDCHVSFCFPDLINWWVLMNFAPRVRACVNVASLFFFSAIVKNYRKISVWNPAKYIWSCKKYYAFRRHCLWKLE